MIFIVETSPVPIYERLATAISEALITAGHIVHFIDASAFKDEEFIKTINSIEYDYYITTNELNKIQSYSSDEDCFLFEKIIGEIIYIHHDNLCSCIHDIDLIYKKFNAFSKLAGTSNHFCIESKNITLLNKIGVKQAHKIQHATEFNLPIRANEFSHEVSFIGHIMSTTRLYPIEVIDYGNLAMTAAWNRVIKMNFNVEDFFYNALEANAKITEGIGKQNFYPKEVYLYHFIASLNKLSSAYRGDIFDNIDGHEITIVGGDLSYGKITDPLMKLNKPNIKYINATTNYSDTKYIYNSTKISLNLSSLQFDSALNPRIFDAFSSGGFLLTDKSSELAMTISDSDEISFNSIEELQSKLSYYKNPKSIRRYNELKEHIRIQIQENHTYNQLIEYIIKKL